MPFPLLAAGAIAAIPSIFQGISGISQASRGKRMLANNVRPVYQRPNEVNQGLALAQQQYANGIMPGTSQAIGNIQAAGAAGMIAAAQAASSSGDILDAINNINYNQGQNFNDLAAQQSAFKNQQLQAYQQQLQINAGYGDKEFSYNKDQPYQQIRHEGLDLIGAGNQNISAAVNGVASIGTSIAMNGASNSAPQNDGTANSNMLRDFQLTNHTAGIVNSNMMDDFRRSFPVIGIPDSDKAIKMNPQTDAALANIFNKKMIFDPYDINKIEINWSPKPDFMPIPGKWRQ